MLEWEGPDENGIWRAYDDYAMYTINHGEDGASYTVGYFPSPGPICEWEKGFSSLDEAKVSAEHCVKYVLEIQGKLDSETE